MREPVRGNLIGKLGGKSEEGEEHLLLTTCVLTCPTVLFTYTECMQIQ